MLARDDLGGLPIGHCQSFQFGDSRPGRSHDRKRGIARHQRFINPTLSVNAANPADVIFTVSGLESGYSGTVTFTGFSRSSGRPACPIEWHVLRQPIKPRGRNNRLVFCRLATRQATS